MHEFERKLCFSFPGLLGPPGSLIGRPGRDGLPWLQGEKGEKGDIGPPCEKG